MFSKPKRKKKTGQKGQLPNSEQAYKNINQTPIPDDDSFGFSPFQRMNKFEGYGYDKANPVQMERGRSNITRSRSFIVPTPRQQIPHNQRLSSLNRTGLRSRFPSPYRNLENINEFGGQIPANFYNPGFYHR